MSCIITVGRKTREVVTVALCTDLLGALAEGNLWVGNLFIVLRLSYVILSGSTVKGQNYTISMKHTDFVYYFI